MNVSGYSGYAIFVQLALVYLIVHADKGPCPNYAKRCQPEGLCIRKHDECDGANCPWTRHECGDESCITLTSRCDRFKDCSDGSDEADGWPSYCNFAVQCKDDEFKCNDENRCLRNYFVCNGDENCADGSDERNCPSDRPAVKRETGNAVFLALVVTGSLLVIAATVGGIVACCCCCKKRNARMRQERHMAYAAHNQPLVTTTYPKMSPVASAPIDPSAPPSYDACVKNV